MNSEQILEQRLSRLIEVVKEMRKLQVNYFSNPHRAKLPMCKEAEKRVDVMLVELEYGTQEKIF